MRIFITGANGQLGHSLRRSLAPHTLELGTRPSFDLLVPGSVRRAIASFEPDVVVHAAAMTDVDGCERDPDAAYRVNALGTVHVANAALAAGAPLVYLSTNFVFDGERAPPYREYDPPRPISAYGASKLAGEQAARDLVSRHYVVRTSWVFGSVSRNFFNSVATWVRERPEVAVVADDRGRPTYARDLADAIAALLETGVFGTYHLVNEGGCNRHEFAAEVAALVGGAARLSPISSEEFARRFPSSAPIARRPANGELENVAAAALGVQLRPWRDALRDFLCAPAS